MLGEGDNKRDLERDRPENPPIEVTSSNSSKPGVLETPRFLDEPVLFAGEEKSNIRSEELLTISRSLLLLLLVVVDSFIQSIGDWLRASIEKVVAAVEKQAALDDFMAGEAPLMTIMSVSLMEKNRPLPSLALSHAKSTKEEDRCRDDDRPRPELSLDMNGDEDVALGDAFRKVVLDGVGLIATRGLIDSFIGEASGFLSATTESGDGSMTSLFLRLNVPVAALYVPF